MVSNKSLKKKQEYRMIADPRAMTMAIVFVIVLVFCSLSAPVWEIKDFIRTGDKTGIVPACVGGGCLCIGALVSFVLLTRQMCVRIVFAKAGITIRPLFGKSAYRPYSYYPYIYKGGYWHGSPVGVGKWVDYIVLSHGRIRDADLLRVNEIGTGNDVIRIRCRKKLYKKLLDALPPEQARKVAVCLEQDRCP